MTWERIVTAAFATLLAVVGGAFAAGNTWNTQAGLPARVANVEAEQEKFGKGLSRVEGKVDTIINMLQRRRD